MGGFRCKPDEVVTYCRANVTCEHILHGNGCPPIEVVDPDEHGLCCGCPNGKVKNNAGVCVDPDQCKCGDHKPGVPIIEKGKMS